MATASERYRSHKVWETLQLKSESLKAARFDEEPLEVWRKDIVDWLDESAKTRMTHRPALYLSVLDDVQAALNELPTDQPTFATYTTRNYSGHRSVEALLAALRKLPLPPPRDLKDSYVALLEKEADTRNTILRDVQEKVAATNKSLEDLQTELLDLSKTVEHLKGEIDAERRAIKSVSETASETIDTQWTASLQAWEENRKAADVEHDAEALTHIAALAATARAGEALAEHAAGDLSAAEWGARAKRERRSAQWIRFGAIVAFLAAGAVGSYIVSEVIRDNFELSVGDGILRSTVAIVIGAFGGLLLRESSRHFREADTAEDVRLSLAALAPFYASAKDEVRLAARVQIGDAVLVRNLLSRFAHRDAARHAGEINTADIPDLVKEAARVLKVPSPTEEGVGEKAGPSK